MAINQHDIRPYFWKKYTLDELNPSEWEALCDGCGMCCLVKLEDDETGDIAYTKVACKLLDCQTGQCSNYDERKKFVPDCIQLTPEKLATINWLPSTCAYVRVAKQQPLPNWHYLITQDRTSIIRAKKSVAKRCISETTIDDNDIDEYIVRWVR